MSAAGPTDVGAALAPWVLDGVPARAMRAMADLLDDPNPIHLDPEATRAVGLGDRPVNQGPANIGYVTNMLLRAYPSAQVRALRTRLLANVFQDDRVVAGGRVEAVDEVADGRRLDCAVWLDVDGRERVLDGRATVVVPRDGGASAPVATTPEPLSGTPLPGGTYRFDARRQQQLVDVLGGVAPADGSAHPLAVWVVAMGGAGISIESLFADQGVAMEDGPMLGGHAFVLHRPLPVPADWVVTGAIGSIEEKSGRRRGPFGVMTVRFEIADAAGAPAASCTNVMILPRGDGAAA